VLLCIPEHLAIQLYLAELERREVVLPDLHRRSVPYVGPVEVRFRNRRCFTGAMVWGHEVLLGAIAMEDMDLVLRPQLQSEQELPATTTALRARVAGSSQAAEIDDVIAAILVARFNGRSIQELCVMGGITLDDFTQSVAYREIFGRGEAQGEAR
jgi:hypothetical protein